MSSSFREYETLFHLNYLSTNNTNTNTNSSSNKAIFYIGFHGVLILLSNSNSYSYLTIKPPVNTTINRWGMRGEPTSFFNTMEYTFKQCLLAYDEKDLNAFNVNNCFEMLGTSLEEFNMHTRQTTTSYCETNTIPILFENNSKMRIKHYTHDEPYFMIFNTDYTIPDTLFTNLLKTIPILNKIKQYNTASAIIDLNFLLFTNNIDFTIFNVLNIKDQTGIDASDLYPDIGLYTRQYLQKYNRKLDNTDLFDFYFPLDIFSFDSQLTIEDFVLERDIYALNNIYINLTYQYNRQNVNKQFVLLKGDSFSCNPYIIEYFIRTFKSKITIRPGPILGAKEHEIFKQNKEEGTTKKKGATITCLSKGLSCYKVTLSVLTNYEILQFCKDARINTCDLYDTSCQSFEHVNEDGFILKNYTLPDPRKRILQRMNSTDDPTMLSTYDNLSDILFNSNNSRRFQVVGVDTEVAVGQKRKNMFPGGSTKKRINKKKKKNSRKQKTKNKTKKRIHRKK
jgi:hypothetical protein